MRNEECRQPTRMRNFGFRISDFGFPTTHPYGIRNAARPPEWGISDFEFRIFARPPAASTLSSREGFAMPKTVFPSKECQILCHPERRWPNGNAVRAPQSRDPPKKETGNIVSTLLLQGIPPLATDRASDFTVTSRSVGMTGFWVSLGRDDSGFAILVPTMDDPAVSVLLPVRNAMPYLNDCIASLERQTLKDFEIIAVDDGSTDGSAEALDEWVRRDPRVIAFHRPASGLVETLNAGLTLCTAPLVARMDADDISHPRRLELQAAALGDDRDLGVVSCLVRHFR